MPFEQSFSPSSGVSPEAVSTMRASKRSFYDLLEFFDELELEHAPARQHPQFKHPQPRSYARLQPQLQLPISKAFISDRQRFQERPAHRSSPSQDTVSISRLLASAVRAHAREQLSPTLCVSCGQRGLFICPNCYSHLPFIDPAWACANCAAPYSWLSCTSCSEPWELAHTRSVLELSPLVHRMIIDFKDRRELRLAPVFAALMSCYFMMVTRDRFDFVCFVPATQKAYQRRGFDHMQLIAQRFCTAVGLSLNDLVLRPFAEDQRKLSRTERLHNLSGTVEILKDCSGQSVLVLDDVITTGASVREVAHALLARGAKTVSALSLARAW